MGKSKQSVLFFGLRFFGYCRKIADEMEREGMTVDYYEESIKGKTGFIVKKLIPGILPFFSDRYYKRLLATCRKKRYDCILFFRTDTLSVKMLERIRNTFPDAQMILYLWDSVKNSPGLMKKIKCFDRVYSFDRVDCRTYPEFRFRPLFYLEEADEKAKAAKHPLASDEQATIPVESKQDVGFWGTIHSDRYPVLKMLEAECQRKGYSFYMYPYLPSRLALWYYKLKDKRYRGTKSKNFEYHKLEITEIDELAAKTKVVVEIQHPDQQGLTMRTMECIHKQQKLVTSNADIVYYDFYRKSNICVIDREHPVIDEGFLEAEYEPIPKEIAAEYSLRAWIREVVQGDEK